MVDHAPNTECAALRGLPSVAYGSTYLPTQYRAQMAIPLLGIVALEEPALPRTGMAQGFATGPTPAARPGSRPLGGGHGVAERETTLAPASPTIPPG